MIAVGAVCGCLVAAAAVGAGWRDKLPAPDKVPDYLQQISVTIKAGSSEGSGVIFTRTAGSEKVSFVWTAAHVIDGLRSVEEVIDGATGTKRQVVKFADASIVREFNQRGRRVGETKVDARVLRFSKEEDLALLEVRARDFTTASAVFYADPTIPPIGTRLFHVGSLLGQMGANSLTPGIVSQIGRTLDNKEFDQSSAVAFPGSSGGGLYTEQGAYIGMVTRGAGEGFNLYIPIRRIVRWAEKANVKWAIDESVPLPSEDEMGKIPIEDAGRTFLQNAVGTKAFPVLIQTTQP